MATEIFNFQALQNLTQIRVLDQNAAFPLIEMQCGDSQATVSLYGGQVLSYQNSRRIVLWPNRHAVFKTGKAIRAGIPICWPWFGPHTDATKPAHGFARTQFWQIESASENAHLSKLVLRLTENTETLALWPHPFQLRLVIQLDETSLKLMLQIHNTGDKAFKFSGALHSYFHISDIAAVAVHDLEQVSYRDQLNGKTDRAKAPIRFDSETDRIYQTEKARVTLRDKGQEDKRKDTLPSATQINSFGHNAIVVWNPWQNKAASMNDIAPDHWRHFICVETAVDPQKPVMVPAGKTALLGVEIHDVSI